MYPPTDVDQENQLIPSQTSIRSKLILRLGAWKNSASGEAEAHRLKQSNENTASGNGKLQTHATSAD